MFDTQTVTFVEGGCALIVGVTLPDGAPYATRGWGLQVRSAGQGLVRLLLAASDTERLPGVFDDAPIAVTGADVPTLRSLQLKGRTVALEPATVEDIERMERYCDGFFGDVERVDGTPRDVMQRLVPARFVACAIQVDTFFDQTPGPGAGAAVTASS